GGGNGPQKILDHGEYDEAEEYADHAIAQIGGAHRLVETVAETLEDGFVKGEADLIAAVRDARRAEVRPCGDGGAGAEDQPKAANPLHIGKQIHQRNQSHQTADGGAAEAENSFLIARADRRERHDETGDDGGVDARIIEADEKEVADQPRERAFHREVDIFGILEGIG